jgi:L-fuconolactonase
MRIDSHHHLWRYRPETFGWISDSMASLRRDFLLPELEMQLKVAHVDGTVLVQAEQTLQETEWLLQLAEDRCILGVVGWAPIAAPDFPGILDQLRRNPLLRGLRHIVQAEPDDFLSTPAFLQGIRHLAGTGLTYDLLVYARQLRLATAFVDSYPAQAFVLDHMGKPDIRRAGLKSWSADIRDLARRPNVTCKLSGLVTEADPAHWTADELLPYLDHVLECFGADRVMIGTDWPVCTAGCTYTQWWSLIESWASPLSAGEREAILGGTAQRVYGLSTGPGDGPLEDRA